MLELRDVLEETEGESSLDELPSGDIDKKGDFESEYSVLEEAVNPPLRDALGEGIEETRETSDIDSLQDREKEGLFDSNEEPDRVIDGDLDREGDFDCVLETVVEVVRIGDCEEDGECEGERLPRDTLAEGVSSEEREDDTERLDVGVDKDERLEEIVRDSIIEREKLPDKEGLNDEDLDMREDMLEKALVETDFEATPDLLSEVLVEGDMEEIADLLSEELVEGDLEEIADLLSEVLVEGDLEGKIDFDVDELLEGDWVEKEDLLGLRLIVGDTVEELDLLADKLTQDELEIVAALEILGVEENEVTFVGVTRTVGVELIRALLDSEEPHDIDAEKLGDLLSKGDNEFEKYIVSLLEAESRVG